MQFIRKYSVALSLIAILFVSAGISYAAYTRVNVVKRVVSTGEGIGDLFASDYMSVSSLVMRKTFSDQNALPYVSVSVFNYPYPKKSAYQRDDTVYTLTATLKKQSEGNTFTELTADEITALGDLDYQIIYKENAFKFGTGGSVSHTFSNCTIAGGDFNQDIFTLRFDPSELTAAQPNGYCMELVARPEDTSLPTLTGYVMVKYVRTASGGWSGRLETLEAGKEYDAYNYIVEGNGTGKITFKWNPTYVRINKWFLQNPDHTFYKNVNVLGSNSVTEGAVTTDADGMRSLTLVVDSKQRSRYEIQFYKVGVDEDDYTNNKISLYLPDTDNVAWVADGQ